VDYFKVQNFEQLSKAKKSESVESDSKTISNLNLISSCSFDEWNAIFSQLLCQKSDTKNFIEYSSGWGQCYKQLFP